MVVEDVTPVLQAEAATVDAGAEEGAKRLKARRPVQNFVEMGIPVGSTLTFSDDATKCTVTSGRRVSFEGEETSLTALTQKLLETDRPLQPSPHWSFAGRKLSAIYDETYETP
jgi:hypothetical protein